MEEGKAEEEEEEVEEEAGMEDAIDMFGGDEGGDDRQAEGPRELHPGQLRHQGRLIDFNLNLIERDDKVQVSRRAK